MCAVLFAVPFLWVARRVDVDALGDALRVAWGFATPAAGAGGARSGWRRCWSGSCWPPPRWGCWRAAAAAGSGRAAFAALALLLVAFDLFKAGMGYNPAIAESQAVQPVTPAIRYLQGERPDRFAGHPPTGPFTLAVPMSPNVAMRYGLYDARGYDFPFEERYAELWRRAIRPAPDCNYAFCPESAGHERRARCAALALLGVTDLLQNRRDAAAGRVPAAYAGPDARVYRNPSALPRAFLVDRQVVAGGADAARDAVTSAGFAARSVGGDREADRGARRGRRGVRAGGERAHHPLRRRAGRGPDRRRAARPAGADRQLVPGLEGDGGRRVTCRSTGSTT